MNDIYISYTYGNEKYRDRAIKYIRENFNSEVVYSKKEQLYDKNSLLQSNHIIFILDECLWSKKIENLSKGMLSELITAINNKKSIYIAYYAQNGIGIYSAEIDENLVLKGIKFTKDNLFGVKELSYELEDSKENSKESYNYSQEPFKYFY